MKQKKHIVKGLKRNIIETKQQIQRNKEQKYYIVR